MGRAGLADNDSAAQHLYEEKRAYPPDWSELWLLH